MLKKKRKKERKCCLCICAFVEGKAQKEIFKQMRFKYKRRHRRAVFVFFFFFKFLCQEIRNAKIFILLWNKNKNFYSDTRPCEGEKVTQRTAYVWGANLAQALYNVKIAKTKYIFKGSDCEDVNKGKRDYFKKWKILPCLYLKHKIIIFLVLRHIFIG